MMFTFEDMVDLDGNSIREILKAVDKNDLMLALKNAAEELKEKFYANMSQRAKDAFIEELQFLGAVKMKEVESAQRRIVDAVQALAEQGILQLGESEEMLE
jgi:flagellar motor switch protein FliG